MTDPTLVDRFSATGYFVLEHLEHITDTTRTPEEQRTHHNAVVLLVSLYMLCVQDVEGPLRTSLAIDSSTDSFVVPLFFLSFFSCLRMGAFFVAMAPP